MNGNLCPKCGARVGKTAKFCSKCGFDLRKIKTSTTRSENDGAAVRPRQHKKIGWKLPAVILGIVIILVAGFFVYQNHQEQESTAANQNSGSQYSATPSTNGNNTGNTNNSNNSNSSALPADVGPKGTTAAITYYAAKTGIGNWSGVLNEDDGITVELSTDDDLLDSLADKGQGMAYEVYGYHNLDDDDETDFVYTLDSDNTVNIYQLPNDLDSDKVYQPKTRIKKSDLINYLNDHNYASRVKYLTSKVDLVKD